LNKQLNGSNNKDTADRTKEHNNYCTNIKDKLSTFQKDFTIFKEYLNS